MPAPRVLPKEHCTAPRLALVDNIDVAADILTEAQRLNAQVVETLELPPVPAPVTRGRYRRHLKLEGKGLNGPVEVRRYDGPVHPAVLAMAEEIMADHGGYVHITGPYTVAVRNHPPKGKR